MSCQCSTKCKYPILEQHLKQETYLVNVTISDGRHYAWPSMDSYVHVRVDEKKHCTGIRKNTDCPYYNEYFVFEFNTNLQTLKDKQLTLTVFRPRTCWRRKKTLGYVTLDLATVWIQPDHIFLQKWAVISSRSDDFVGPRGYLKVTLSITTKGQKARIPVADPKANDQIEGNLLLPEGLTLERQRAMFVFKVYKGEDFSKKLPGILANLKHREFSVSEMPSTCIEITFAGVKVCTSVQKQTCTPVWNEMLTIAELFPPLCQNVKIELKTTNSNLCAIKYLNLHSIANDQEYGFLPTFGPAYIHFYTTDKFGEVYVGKVLIALHTQLQHDYLVSQKFTLRKNLFPLNELTLWKYEPVLLFGAILNVNAIDRRFSSKPIRFEISIGNTWLENTLAAGDGGALNITDGYHPKTLNKRCWFLEFAEDIPCVSFQNRFPDLRKRFYNANMIEKIAGELKERLDDMEHLFEHERNQIPSDLIETKLVEALDTLAAGCRKYIDMVQPSVDTYVTDLDREKYKLCIRELENIEAQAKTIYNPKTKKKSYRKAQKLYRRLHLLIDHPQDCWPDILIYMLHDEKKVATAKIETEDVIYSMVDEEKGKNCGKIQHIYFHTPLKLKNANFATTACKMDLLLWAGLKRHREFCFGALPKGSSFPTDLPKNAIPSYLLNQEKHVFQCRAHIYQGRFTHATDSSGLADLSVRAILNRQCGSTRTIRRRLNPLWNETLTFRNVIIYGSSEFIKTNPPVILMEIIDKDDRCQNDYLGRAMVAPLVKLRDEPYTLPEFPPKLKWHKVQNIERVLGEVLACAEYLEKTVSFEGDGGNDEAEITELPKDIKPQLMGYKIDILFWGLRQLKTLHLLSISRPKITVEISDVTLDSDVILKKETNFTRSKKHLLVDLPVEEAYVPPICFKLFDNRSFGRFTYAGNHLARVDQFVIHPMTKEERDLKLSTKIEKSYDSMDSKVESVKDAPIKEDETKLQVMNKQGEKLDVVTIKMEKEKGGCCSCCRNWCRRRKKKNQKPHVVLTKSSITELENVPMEDDFTDWWTKYFASIEPSSTVQDEIDAAFRHENKNFHLKIYNNELEQQPEFEGFQDTLVSFTMLRGESSGDEDVDERNVTGVLKGNVRIYRWPPQKGVNYVNKNGSPLKDGYFQDAPPNEPKSFIVRVYCVRAIKLRPKDPTGKADSYVKVTMGNRAIKDSEHYVPKQINPIYGRCFELPVTFPQDTEITVAVYDWDRLTKDDLIGQTKIDIENRYYTRHRANCGLPYEYTEIGFTPWRCRKKPSEILEKLCERGNLPQPQYINNSVKIDPYSFAPSLGKDEAPPPSYTVEQLALSALHRWQEIPIVGCHLVPEHVETRSLYHPEKPGVEQGKIQLWIDVFPCTDLPPPMQVNIAPREPLGYELRVIIWNTEEVILEEDDFFVGEKKSDIYVKGWFTGSQDAQHTDVHYRSLSGEGMFNWRFVFPFKYLRTENKIVVTRKERAFDIVAAEQKVPCRLKLQVWDNDTFSPDDFLGSLTMELTRMPRGAKSARRCKLSLLEPSAPKINLFQVKRTRGWWPFRGIDAKKNRYIVAGKLEAEFHLVTAEEAQLNPVGLGRREPQPLPKPNRPDTSFSWFKNPLKLMKFLVCKHYKWKIIRCIVFLMLCAFIVLMIYSFPGYTVKRFLGA